MKQTLIMPEIFFSLFSVLLLIDPLPSIPPTFPPFAPRFGVNNVITNTPVQSWHISPSGAGRVRPFCKQPKGIVTRFAKVDTARSMARSTANFLQPRGDPWQNDWLHLSGVSVSETPKDSFLVEQRTWSVAGSLVQVRENGENDDHPLHCLVLCLRR